MWLKARTRRPHRASLAVASRWLVVRAAQAATRIRARPVPARTSIPDSRAVPPVTWRSMVCCTSTGVTTRPPPATRARARVRAAPCAARARRPAPAAAAAWPGCARRRPAAVPHGGALRRLGLLVGADQPGVAGGGGQEPVVVAVGGRRPSSRYRTRSARAMVASREATTTVVVAGRWPSRPPRMAASVTGSTLEVASSRTSSRAGRPGRGPGRPAGAARRQGRPRSPTTVS